MARSKRFDMTGSTCRISIDADKTLEQDAAEIRMRAERHIRCDKSRT
jgi:hypothetical protein